jgi:hypothetical protein
MIMLSAGLIAKNAEEKVQMLDVVEIVEKATIM